MRMTKDQIVHEIRRTAEANGGTPLGARRLADEAGIKESEWKRFWPRLGDAHDELGLGRNELSKAYSPEELLATYAALAQSLGRLPTENDLAFKAKNDEAFPSYKTFSKRLGSKEALVRKLAEYCASHTEFEGVLQFCEQYQPRRREPDPCEPGRPAAAAGFVYMLKHGSRREYKIGRTNNAIRREGEIAIELPEKVQPVHVMSTDDPAGIEAYWHRRFAEKRKQGEWFELNAADVSAFKRRKYM